MNRLNCFSGGTSSQGAHVEISKDYHAAAAAERERQHAESMRREQMIRDAERRMEQERFEQERRYRERANPQSQQQSALPYGGGGSGAPPHSGPNNGGPGGNHPLNGFSSDMVNLVDLNSQIIRGSAREGNRAAYERYGQDAIPPYHPSFDPVRMNSNPAPNPEPYVVQFHKFDELGAAVHSSFHASMEEIQSRAGFVFNHRAGADMGTSVKRYLDLPSAPTHYSLAKLSTDPADVTLSYTISRRQQAEIRPDKIEYHHTGMIENFMNFFQFKPRGK